MSNKISEWIKSASRTLAVYLLWYSLIAYVKISKALGLRDPLSEKRSKSGKS